MKPVLGVDVDSTVWDTSSWVREAVLEATGDTLDMETIATWTHLLDTYGEETTTRIFNRVLSPGRVAERVPYPNASGVLRGLQEQRGIRIHFITYNWDPAFMTPRLEPWLKEHFGPDVGLTVTTEDKLLVLGELGAFGMIDDRPGTIERVADAGLWAAAKVQPWNRDLLAETPDVHGFLDWREVPALLPPLRDSIYGG